MANKDALWQKRDQTYAMAAGDGPLSYAKNSAYQRAAVDVAKIIIEEEISTKLDLIKTSPNGTIYIADFGCSTGHNSFTAVQIITNAINQKHHDQQNYTKTLEFFVFFNDMVSNDFNTLFSSLPPNTDYKALAVPGDFHGRLMPKSSLHFAYSSWSLHWLTQVPDNGNPSWNKGQIYYTNDRKEIKDAYLEQYSQDIGAFLEARAVEMVDGGLMALLIAGVPPLYVSCDYILMGSCLMDMAKKGTLDESMVDSFNLPLYFPTQEELKPILERNHSFNIEKFEIFENPGKYIRRGIEERATFLRATTESLLKSHFGSEFDLDEMFDIYKKKLEASPALQDPENDESFMILVVLKRNLSERPIS